MRWWRRVILRRPEHEPRVTVAQRIRMALEELGPTFVKFGQIVSTRPDLVPAPIIAELESCRSTSLPFPEARPCESSKPRSGNPAPRWLPKSTPRPGRPGPL